jgi:hypothetical protein
MVLRPGTGGQVGMGEVVPAERLALRFHNAYGTVGRQDPVPTLSHPPPMNCRVFLLLVLLVAAVPVTAMYCATDGAEVCQRVVGR